MNFITPQNAYHLLENLAQWLGWIVAIAFGLHHVFRWIRRAWRAPGEAIEATDGFFERRRSVRVRHRQEQDALTWIVEHQPTLQTLARQLTPNGGGHLIDVPGRIGAVHDDVKKLGESLSRNQTILASRIAGIMDVSGRAMWSCDGSGAFTWANREFLELYQCSLEDVRGSNWENFIHPDDRPKVVSAWEDTVRKKRNNDVFYRVRRNDMTEVHLHSHGEPTVDERGEVLEWFGFVEVVTTSLPVPQPAHLFKALWVDDARDILEIAGHYFREGVKSVDLVTTPTPGDAIQQYAAALSRGRAFDAVVLDYMMPGLDGLAVARSIRDQERAMNSRHHCRLAICSGASDQLLERQSELNEIDCVKVFPKPVSMQEVAGWLVGAI